MVNRAWSRAAAGAVLRQWWHCLSRLHRSMTLRAVPVWHEVHGPRVVERKCLDCAWTA